MLKASPKPDEIVSSEAELLVLVDSEDREIGYRSKSDCHDRGGILHRAFSLFVFNPDGEVLIQRRAAGKRLWPNYWSNSCCSHPRKGESMEDATHRRLFQELRIRSELNYLYKFQYSAPFGELGSENELCWVFAGVTADKVRPNRTEVSDWRFLHPDQLGRELENQPEHFTPWFKLEWPQVRDRFVNSPEFPRRAAASGSALTTGTEGP